MITLYQANVIHAMRLLLPVILAMGLSMSASLAQSTPSTPDGIYKPTQLEAYVTLAGKRLNLPIGTLRSALLKRGLLIVRNQRAPIQKSKWEPVLEKFKFLGIKGNASVSAPDHLVFKRSQSGNRDRFSGKLSKPLRISMKGRYRRLPATVVMRTPLNATIQRDTLRIDAPLSVSVFKITAKGRLRMTAERKAILPPAKP